MFLVHLLVFFWVSGPASSWAGTKASSFRKKGPFPAEEEEEDPKAFQQMASDDGRDRVQTEPEWRENSLNKIDCC